MTMSAILSLLTLEVSHRNKQITWQDTAITQRHHDRTTEIVTSWFPREEYLCQHAEICLRAIKTGGGSGNTSMRTKTFVINSRSGALRTASALTSKTSRPVAAAMSTPESMNVRVKVHSLQLEHHAGQRFPVRYRPSLTVGDHWRRSSAGVPTASWPRVSLMESVLCLNSRTRLH